MSRIIETPRPGSLLRAVLIIVLYSYRYLTYAYIPSRRWMFELEHGDPVRRDAAELVIEIAGYLVPVVIWCRRLKDGPRWASIEPSSDYG